MCDDVTSQCTWATSNITSLSEPAPTSFGRWQRLKKIAQTRDISQSQFVVKTKISATNPNNEHQKSIIVIPTSIKQQLELLIIAFATHWLTIKYLLQLQCESLIFWLLVSQQPRTQERVPQCEHNLHFLQSKTTDLLFLYIAKSNQCIPHSDTAG